MKVNVILVGFMIMMQTAGTGSVAPVYMSFGSMTECAKARTFIEQESRKTGGPADVEAHLQCMISSKKGYSTGS